MSVIKNYIYYLIFQILSMILPIITIPYVSGILGAEGIGVNAFTFSIAQYFMLFATLGITLYGNRQIAYVRDDLQARNNTFWEICLIKLCTTAVSLASYLIWIFIFATKFKLIFIIQSINILSIALDISWFFVGLEEFRKTITRNIIVKIMGVALIFIFIKQPKDVWKYVLILASTELLGQASLWIYMPGYVTFPSLKDLKVIRHFTPVMSIFISQVAIQIYSVVDRSMLGILSEESQVGLYDMAQKIVKLSITIVTTLGTVILPNLSNLYIKNDMETIKKQMSKYFLFASYLSIPIMFGIIGIADTLVPWFLGSNFLDSIILLKITSPIIVFCAWSSFLGTYLVSSNNQKQATTAVIFGAVTNVIFNSIFIPNYEAIGACIGTVIAEFSVFLVEFYFSRNILSFKNSLSSISKYILSSSVMFLVIKFIENCLGVHWYVTFIQIISGVMIYVSILFTLKEKMNKEILYKVIYQGVKALTFIQGKIKSS